MYKEDIDERFGKTDELHTNFIGFSARLHSGMYDRIHDVCIYD